MKQTALCTLLMFCAMSIGLAQTTDENWRDSIATLLVNFIKSETWEDASEYVMEPERVKPLMRQHYESRGFYSKLLSKEEIKHDYGMRKIQGKQHVIYICGSYYVIKTDTGYKIDWEASFYRPYSTKAMESYPNKEFEIRDNIRFYERWGNSCNRYLGDCSYYVKSTSINNILFDLLKDGNPRPFLLKVKYVTPDSGGHDKNIFSGPYFTITEVISTNFSKY